MSDETIGTTNLVDSSTGVTVARLLTHLRNPQNLLTYMIFTAWTKFMGIASYVPSITVGG